MPLLYTRRDHYMCYAVFNYISLPFLYIAVLKFFSIVNNREGGKTDEGKYIEVQKASKVQT